MNATAHEPLPRLGVLLGAESDAEADAFEELAARTLALLVEPVEPPAALRGALLAEIAGPSPRSSGRHVAEVDAAARTTPVGFLARLRAPGRFDADPVASRDELTGMRDARSATTAFLDGAASIDVVSSASAGASIATLRGLPAQPKGRAYQFWLIRNGKPRAAGTFTPAAGTTAIRVGARYRAGDVVAITVEPAGGSRKPTTEPLFALAS
jgi:hypothetical protein